jgi:SAM-dependent methyltransferase
MHAQQQENLAITRIEVETDFPVAADSLDHQIPLGTAQDNSMNLLFNKSLYALLRRDENFPRVLDLGCSGGAFVKSCLDQGCIAVGIEGSDFSKKFGRAEWGALGGRVLFTADITKPFRVYGWFDGEKKALCFDVITAWEVLEHIPEASLPEMFKNIANHLLPGGIAVFSVSAGDSWFMGVNLHQTKRDKQWWITQAKQAGFTYCPQLVRYFSPQFVRGPRRQRRDAFHLVLVLDGSVPPSIPRFSFKHRIYRRWMGSAVHRFLKKLL